MRTPYPSHLVGAGFGSGTPGSCGGCGTDDDDGFVLFTSQNYVRQSQPAISPNFGTGVSTQAGEELGEPTTTPSQDSRVSRGCRLGLVIFHCKWVVGWGGWDLQQLVLRTVVGQMWRGGASC